MTWIRWDVPTPRESLIGVLAKILKVRPAEAHGLYCATWCGFAEHQPDGRAVGVTDDNLELWACWQRKRGRFARVFREHCVEQREGEKDLPGVVRGWWKQLAGLRDQERSRNKRRNPGEAPADTPDEPRGVFPVDVDVDEDVRAPVLSAAPAISGLDFIRYSAKCTAAANRGLRENRSVTGFNELVTSNQLEETRPWYDAGIPLDVVEAAIYHRAKSYRPKGRRIQPTTLGYFRECVEEAHARALGRAIEGSVTTTPPAEPDPLAGWAARKEAERANQNT